MDLGGLAMPLLQRTSAILAGGLRTHGQTIMMPMMLTKKVMPDKLILQSVEKKIITLRSEKVILDGSVAELYGVETRELAQAVKNNPDKFPAGYIFELSKQEKNEVIKIFDNLKIKFSPTNPKAFTEKGLYMLATILKSKQATATTLAIIEAFAQLRELSRAVAELSESQDKNTQKSLMERSGEIMSELLYGGLEKSDSETSLEINLAIMKFKHTVKRKKK